jgi:hypothetical protein
LGNGLSPVSVARTGIGRGEAAARRGANWRHGNAGPAYQRIAARNAGHFVEFEVVLGDNEAADAGTAIALDLLA